MTAPLETARKQSPQWHATIEIQNAFANLALGLFTLTTSRPRVREIARLDLFGVRPTSRVRVRHFRVVRECRQCNAAEGYSFGGASRCRIMLRGGECQRCRAYQLELLK